ncbi:MAG: NAD(P)-dependent oxidoreductase [Geminicoccaceae bacterium]
MTRVLLTGAASFTGAWITAALSARGAQVIAPLRGDCGGDGMEEGSRLRHLRIRLAGRTALLVEHAPTGSQRLLDLVDETGPFDLVCLHGADVGDFRSAGYDPLAAAARNCDGIDMLLARLARQGCRRIVVSGSLFEADEGGADGHRPAIGAYGLAKTLSWHCLRFAAERNGLAVGKVVIPHPFGPLEKPGLVSELMTSWQCGRIASIRHAARIRDFIPVQRLAGAYADFALDMPARPGLYRLAPGGLAESVGDFTARLAREMRPLLGRPCRFTAAAVPTGHPDDREPAVRINCDPVLDSDGGDLAAVWRALAEFYSEHNHANGRALSING